MVDLKELQKLVKYLRKEGITEFKSGDLEFKLGAAPTKKSEKKLDVSEAVNINTSGPTQEDLLFWSAGGAAAPKEDS